MQVNRSINQAGLARVAGQMLKDIHAHDRDEARKALIGRMGPYGLTPSMVEMALDRYFSRT